MKLLKKSILPTPGFEPVTHEWLCTSTYALINWATLADGREEGKRNFYYESNIAIFDFLASMVRGGKRFTNENCSFYNWRHFKFYDTLTDNDRQRKKVPKTDRLLLVYLSQIVHRKNMLHQKAYQVIQKV